MMEVIEELNSASYEQMLRIQDMFEEVIPQSAECFGEIYHNAMHN
jgi:hypothetical protein